MNYVDKWAFECVCVCGGGGGVCLSVCDCNCVSVCALEGAFRKSELAAGEATVAIY